MTTLTLFDIYHEYTFSILIYILYLVCACILIYYFLKFKKFLQTLQELSNDSLITIVKDFMIYRIRLWFIETFSSGLVIRKPDSPHIDIIYYDGHDMYTVRFIKRRGPRPFTRVLDENGMDITDIFIKFLGPCNNFHNIITTPLMLGFSSLSFENTRTKYTKIFNGNEPIIF
jgi:hypothetical protein